MSPIQLVMLFMYWADLVLSVAAAATCVWAFVQAAAAAPNAYKFHDKRTKGFWMGLTGGSALFSVLMLWLVLRGGMMSSMLLFELIAITIAMVCTPASGAACNWCHSGVLPGAVIRAGVGSGICAVMCPHPGF